MLAAVLCLAGLAIVLSGGCKKEEPAATAVGGAAVTAAQFANTKCPIMGMAIDAAKAPAAQTREFKGQKVAFCSADCPAKWDALSDEEKAVKLAAAK
jgi:hypothetical protein